MKLLYTHIVLLVGVAVTIAMPALQQGEEQKLEDLELSTQKLQGQISDGQNDAIKIRNWLSKIWKKNDNSQDLDVDEAVARSWLSKQLKKLGHIHGGITIDGGHFNGNIGIQGKREESSDQGIDEEAVVRSWLSKQLKKLLNHVNIKVHVGKREESSGQGIDEEAVVRSWLSKNLKKLGHIHGGITIDGGHFNGNIGIQGKREESSGQGIDEEAVVRSWLSKALKKLGHHVHGGIGIDGSGHVHGSIGINGKREESSGQAIDEEAVVRSLA